MLYQLYESQRTLMEPFVDFAQAAAKLYSGSLSPIGKTPLAQRVSAGYSLMYRLGKDYEKPSFDIHQIDVDKEGVSLAIHERVEVDKPFCELRRFKRFTDDSATLTLLKDQPAVLVVAPLSGHYSTLLRDTVKTMLKDHKVYITDWKNARNVPLSDGAFHLDDYVNYVQEFIRHLQGKYGNCHVISVCQPTVPVFAAISLMASRGEKTPLSMIMMGGPIDARMSPTSVNNLATNKPFEWFENNVIYRVPANFPGKGRRVYPGFLQHTGFVAMNPDRHATSHYDYFKNLIKGDDASTEAHRKFYDEYNAVLDMDADYYLETIKTVFQDFKLVNGTWDVMSVDGKLERVKPGDIKTTAVMTVEGELDDISGAGQTRAALDMCSGVAEGQKMHLEAKGAGHYGIFSGRRWRDVVYPAVKAFILEHNKPLAQSKQALIATKRVAKPAKTAKAVAPMTVEASAEAAPVEAAKPVAIPRTVAKAAKQKSAAVTLEPAAMPTPDTAEKSVAKAPALQPADALAPTETKPSAKPMLVAVKNTAAEPVPVIDSAAPVAAQDITTPAASAAAPEDAAAANTIPRPPEKSAA
ncbi:polyhydroxyalkanoate depolymerase [soil metagenome]